VECGEGQWGMLHKLYTLLLFTTVQGEEVQLVSNEQVNEIFE
jgi:hypothetical protein